MFDQVLSEVNAFVTVFSFGFKFVVHVSCGLVLTTSGNWKTLEPLVSIGEFHALFKPESNDAVESGEDFPVPLLKTFFPGTVANVKTSSLVELIAENGVLGVFGLAGTGLPNCACWYMGDADLGDEEEELCEGDEGSYHSISGLLHSFGKYLAIDGGRGKLAF